MFSNPNSNLNNNPNIKYLDERFVVDSHTISEGNRYLIQYNINSNNKEFNEFYNMKYSFDLTRQQRTDIQDESTDGVGKQLKSDETGTDIKFSINYYFIPRIKNRDKDVLFNKIHNDKNNYYYIILIITEKINDNEYKYKHYLLTVNKGEIDTKKIYLIPIKTELYNNSEELVFYKSENERLTPTDINFILENDFNFSNTITSKGSWY